MLVEGSRGKCFVERSRCGSVTRHGCKTFARLASDNARSGFCACVCALRRWLAAQVRRIEEITRDNTGQRVFMEGLVLPTASFPSDHAMISATFHLHPHPGTAGACPIAAAVEEEEVAVTKTEAEEQTVPGGMVWRRGSIHDRTLYDYWGLSELPAPLSTAAAAVATAAGRRNLSKDLSWPHSQSRSLQPNHCSHDAISDGGDHAFLPSSFQGTDSGSADGEGGACWAAARHDMDAVTAACRAAAARHERSIWILFTTHPVSVALCKPWFLLLIFVAMSTTTSHSLSKLHEARQASSPPAASHYRFTYFPPPGGSAGGGAWAGIDPASVRLFLDGAELGVEGYPSTNGTALSLAFPRPVPANGWRFVARLPPPAPGLALATARYAVERSADGERWERLEVPPWPPAVNTQAPPAEGLDAAPALGDGVGGSTGASRDGTRGGNGVGVGETSRGGAEEASRGRLIEVWVDLRPDWKWLIDAKLLLYNSSLVVFVIGLGLTGRGPQATLLFGILYWFGGSVMAFLCISEFFGPSQAVGNPVSPAILFTPSALGPAANAWYRNAARDHRVAVSGVERGLEDGEECAENGGSAPFQKVHGFFHLRSLTSLTISASLMRESCLLLEVCTAAHLLQFVALFLAWQPAEAHGETPATTITPSCEDGSSVNRLHEASGAGWWLRQAVALGMGRRRQVQNLLGMVRAYLASLSLVCLLVARALTLHWVFCRLVLRDRQAYAAQWRALMRTRPDELERLQLLANRVAASLHSSASVRQMCEEPIAAVGTAQGYQLRPAGSLNQLLDVAKRLSPLLRSHAQRLALASRGRFPVLGKPADPPGGHASRMRPDSASTAGADVLKNHNGEPRPDAARKDARAERMIVQGDAGAVEPDTKQVEPGAAIQATCVQPGPANHKEHAPNDVACEEEMKAACPAPTMADQEVQYVRWEELGECSGERACRVQWASVKDGYRALEKLLRSYDCDESLLLDCCRCALLPAYLPCTPFPAHLLPL